tara:strand:- start:2026 stop:2745 length:720 start_codon:yes stop_codon:yes gene_type:complete
MKIFPAIDIKGGKCVRLLKGDFNNITQYKKSPLEQANAFADFGFTHLHLIDLDGALEGKIINKNIIQDIAKINNIKIQVGGGIRSLEQIEHLLNFGVDKVIIGTKAIEDLKFLKNVCEKFKGKVVLGIDVRNGFIALSGWKKQTNILASDFIKKVDGLDISRIIYTDIDRDGTKSGPNIEGTIKFSNLTKIPVVFSGGISSLQDVINIRKKKSEKIEGVIVGKAIYDESINLKDLSKVI